MVQHTYTSSCPASLPAAHSLSGIATLSQRRSPLHRRLQATHWQPVCIIRCALLLLLLQLLVSVMQLQAAPTDTSSTSSTGSTNNWEMRVLLKLVDSLVDCSFPEYSDMLDSEDVPILFNSWQPNNTFSAWTGVGVAGGHVTSLDFSRYDFGSACFLSLPAAFSSLQALQDITMCTECVLQGDLPQAWSVLTQLTHVDLSGCAYETATEGFSIDGRPPSSWSMLSSLRYLDLCFNGSEQWSWELPSSWSALSKLEYLAVCSVNILPHPRLSSWLTGLQRLTSLAMNIQPEDATADAVTVLESLSGLAGLRELVVQAPGLPSHSLSAWSALSKLEYLALTMNWGAVQAAAGSSLLPPEWGRLQRLTWLDLAGDGLAQTDTTAVFPAAWSALTSLEGLSVSMPGNVSTIPAAWVTLTRVTHLWLTGVVDDRPTVCSRQFRALLDSLSVFVGLQQLSLEVDSMAGCYVSLPRAWSALTNLSDYSVMGPSWRGGLPSEWSTLTRLSGMGFVRDFNTYDEDGQLDAFFNGSLPAAWSRLTRLQHMSLGKNALTGSLPPGWSTLTRLNSISLASNLLTGPIPASWSTLTRLEYIGLARNSLSGSLPSAWSSLTLLTEVTLDTNAFTGQLPPEWTTLTRLSSLGSWDLSRNGFTSLPAAWSAMTWWTSLDLSHNHLAAQLPPEWSALTTLDRLSLTNNSLSGTLPAPWSALTNLELDLQMNRIRGSLPPEWSCLSSLQLAFNQLTGGVPQEWGLPVGGEKLLRAVNVSHNLLSLRLPQPWIVWLTIDLSYNQLKGPLPLHINLSAGSSELFLAHNQLSGSLPSTWAHDLLAKDVSLNLAANALSGSLPLVWSVLTDLRSLNLSGNHMEGSLPLVWGDMFHGTERTALSPGAVFNRTKMCSIDLSNNSLTGSIPDSWSKMIGLTHLQLSRNHFTGLLPSWLPRLIELRNIDLSFNMFQGTLPTNLVNISVLHGLFVASNQLHGTLPPAYSSLFGCSVVCSEMLLAVDHNKLSGTIPPSWFDRMYTDWNDSHNMMMYLDVSSNSLTGTVPALPAFVKYFNASNNSLAGTVPAIPDNLVYLQMSYNQLEGAVPDINSSNLVYVNLESNRLTALPHTLNASNLTFLSIANNQLSGRLHEAVASWQHGLLYCNLAYNQLAGQLPEEWARHEWLVLALSNNQLSGSLPTLWPGVVSVVQLQRNNLSGCLPQRWASNDTALVISLSHNPLGCKLPGGWGNPNSFQNLSVLYLQGCDFDGVVPRSWISEAAFRSDTKLGLGDMWKESGRQDRQWRQEVCTQRGFNEKLKQKLGKGEVPVEVVDALLQTLKSAGLDNLSRVLMELNVSKEFEVPQLNVAFEVSDQGTAGDICNNQGAGVIVSVQWGVVALLLVLMWVWYTVVAHRRMLKSQGRTHHCQAQQLRQPHEHSPRCSSLAVSCCPDFHLKIRRCPTGWSVLCSQMTDALARCKQRVEQALVTCKPFTEPLLHAVGLVAYWYDMVSDVLVVLAVGNLWPSYLLLSFILLHCLVSATILVWHWHAGGHLLLWCTVPAVLVLTPAVPVLDSAVYTLKLLQSKSECLCKVSTPHGGSTNAVPHAPHHSLGNSPMDNKSCPTTHNTDTQQVQRIDQIARMCDAETSGQDVSWEGGHDRCTATAGLPCIVHVGHALTESSVASSGNMRAAGAVRPWPPCWKQLQLPESLSWARVQHMREVWEVLLESVPTAVVQSVIFLKGNDPNSGLFLDNQIYVLSAIGSAFQILRLTLSVLIGAVKCGAPPAAVLLTRMLCRKGEGEDAEGSDDDVSVNTKVAALGLRVL